MESTYQFLTLVAMLVGGFGWIISWLRSIDRRLNDLETRVTVIETRLGFVERLLEMMGLPIKGILKEKTNP